VPERIDAATARGIRGATFECFDGVRLAHDPESFDGAFVNEVLEHVTDERQALKEIYRVLRPGGYLAVMSPNRWFPVDGHAVTIAGHRFGPAPLIPWLPERLTRRWTDARNYWPHQLVDHVRACGFAILDTGFIWPVLEEYAWLPAGLISKYQDRIHQFDHAHGLRRFGLSTLIVAVRPVHLDQQLTSL
jgi:SAM-dependent methyltransferase